MAMLKHIQNPREAALLILDNIYQRGAYANLALAKGLRGAPLSLLDRKLATELVYGTVKTTGTLDWYLCRVINRPFRKMAPRLRTILRMGAFQILYLERIPDSAAVNESANLTRKYVNENSVKLVNGVLRQLSRTKQQWKFPEGENHIFERIALEQFHPEWLVRRWNYRFGLAEAEAMCRYDNQVPPVCVRANTLRISRDELLEKLTDLGIRAEASTWSADGIICRHIPSLESMMKEYGPLLYIQDESSMLVAPILNPKPMDTVLDFCSAPGGKTTHLAQYMQNKGSILAMDLYDHKLRLVQENASRLGITCITTLVHDGTQPLKGWESKADAVLVDAPCSGLGVLNRRAEARWTKQERTLSQFPPIQKKILSNAARCVKVGGHLLYSTCTLERDENSRVRTAFLETHPEFRSLPFSHPLTGEPVEELQILPWRVGIDGFYLCLFEKVNEETGNV
jgi:16S rRNA (cytosine967-C5)-methyltransferase